MYILRLTWKLHFFTSSFDPCVFVCLFVLLYHSPLICFRLTSCPVSSQVLLLEPYVLLLSEKVSPFPQVLVLSLIPRSNCLYLGVNVLVLSPVVSVCAILTWIAPFALSNELTSHEVQTFWNQFSEPPHPSLLWVYIWLGTITKEAFVRYALQERASTKNLFFYNST